MTESPEPTIAAVALRLPGHRAGQAARTRTAAISWPAFLGWVAASFTISLAGVWLYVATMPMAFLDRDYPLLIAKQTMLAQCQPDTVDVFGDSRAEAAVMPAAMHMRVTNYALSGTSPVETYFLLRRALQCPYPPRLVVIAHSPMKFEDDADFWVFSARTGFLDLADMRDVARTAAAVHDESLSGRGDRPFWLQSRLYDIRFPPLYFDSLVHGFVVGRWQYNLSVVQESIDSRGHALFGTADGSSGLAPEATPSHFVPSPLVDAYLDRSLELLASRHVPVVLLLPPINQATLTQSHAGFRQGLDAYLAALRQHHPDLIIANPTLRCWPNSEFGDAWHFNARGAEAFSQQLGAWLRTVLSGAAATALPGRCT